MGFENVSVSLAPREDERPRSDREGLLHHRECLFGEGHAERGVEVPHLVRRSEDGAVAELGHVGDVGPKREYHHRSKCNSSNYLFQIHLFEIEEVSLIQ